MAVITTVLCWCFGTGVAAAYENEAQLVTATVYQAGQLPTADSVSIGTLESDPQRCPTYSGPEEGFIGPGGDDSLPATSWSLASVLGCLQNPVKIVDINAITIIRQNGVPEAAATSQIGPADLSVPSDFADQSQVPVISSDGDGIIYNRPSRGTGDANGADRVEDDLPSPFLIDVFEGPSLAVTAAASQTTIAAGANVSFSATASGPDDGGLSYSWNFDGGGLPDSSTAQNPEVTFDSPGVYEVTVEASDGAGGGGSGSIQITVNSATGQSPGNSSPHSPATGPQTSHGNQPGGAAGKHDTHGSGTSGRGGDDGRYKQRQQHGSAGSAAAGSGGASASSGSTDKSGGTAGAGNRAPVKEQRKPPRSRAPHGAGRHRPAPSAEIPASAPDVTGRLISDVTLLPAGVSPLVRVVQAPLGTAPAARRVIHASVLPALAAALAVVLLFGLGAGRELAGRRGRRALRFGG